MRTICSLGFAAATAISATAQTPPQPPPPTPVAFELPAPTGTSKVGTTSWRVTDESRPETFAAAGVSRQVEVLAWYPAGAVTAGSKTAPYLREGMAEVPPGLRVPLAALADVRTHSVLDAEPSAPAAGPKTFPVLVLSHGYGGIPSSYTALAEDLASHGYVVLSIVHPYEATAATLADGSVIPLFDETGKPRQSFLDVVAEWKAEDETMAAVTREKDEEAQLRLLRGYLDGLRASNQTVERWVKDTKLVLDRLPETGVPGQLAARLDLGRLGALGHSMGGVVSGQFCLDDARCRAGLNLDGIPQYGTMIDKRLSQPFLMVYSARPGRTGASDPIYRRAASRYYRVDVADTLHLDFSDMILWGGPLKGGALGKLAPARATEITRTIVLQYFDQELLGKPSPLLSGKTMMPEVTVKSFARGDK